MRVEQLAAQLSRVEDKLDEALSSLDFLTDRLSSYLGGGVALTYLVDGTPIYVNSEDFGPPANFICGGRYEEDNLAVLQSFVRCDTTFLDVGANLGVFSLQIAARARYGRVIAFEPHPQLARLARASSYLNGFSQLASGGLITVHEIGLSDQDSTLGFSYPADHLGGGGVGAARGPRSVSFPVRRLDGLMDEGFVCDLIKIDVEGHEPEALAGMERVLKRSPDVKVMFEKLHADAGFEAQLETRLRDMGFALYGVGAGARLAPIAAGGLAAFAGYALAAREPDLEPSRTRFSIYPRQLSAWPETLVSLDRDHLRAAGGPGEILFHGPYWRLPQGVWRVSLRGEVEGRLSLTVAARYGHAVQTIDWDRAKSEAIVACPRALKHFEIVGRAIDGRAAVSIDRFDIERIG